MHRRGFIIQHIVIAVAFSASPLVSQTQADIAQDDLAKPFDWPMIVSPTGVQFFLRTRWDAGVLRYVVTLTDSKDRIAKWFSKHPDTGPVPFSTFQVTFEDEENFHLYTLYLHDRTFAKVAGTANWESKGESQCAEKIYRSALKAVKATGASEQSSHGFNYPLEFEAPSPLPPSTQRRKNQ